MENKQNEIVKKLKYLECPQLQNKDGASARELLLKPSSSQNEERLMLMEWILSKLGFTVQKTRNQTTSEARNKSLLTTIFALGLCKNNDTALIEGKANESTQIQFWETLVNILFRKEALNVCTDEAYVSGESDIECQTISDVYNQHCCTLNKIFETVNLDYLFKESVKLFPSDLQIEASKNAKKYVENKPESLDLLEKENTPEDKKCLKSFENKLYFAETYDSVDTLKDDLNSTEDRIASSLKTLQALANDEFCKLHANLEPYLLSIAPEKLLTVGPEFESLQKQLESLLEFKKSLKVIKSADSELKSISEDISRVNVPNGCMSDALLTHYIGILQDEKMENSSGSRDKN